MKVSKTIIVTNSGTKNTDQFSLLLFDCCYLTNYAFMLTFQNNLLRKWFRIKRTSKNYGNE